MAVYVDDMRAPFGRMVMCHMIADSHDELVAMAQRIGVAPKWIQQAGTYSEHFDVCLSARVKAVAVGAIELTSRELVQRMNARRAWEVWQGSTLVCSAQMRLTEAQARNKVENERRLGYVMEAKPAVRQ